MLITSHNIYLLPIYPHETNNPWEKYSKYIFIRINIGIEHFWREDDRFVLIMMSQILAVSIIFSGEDQPDTALED